MLHKSPINFRNDDNIAFSLAEHGDLEVIFLWQQEPNIRKYARNPKPPSWEEHVKWFEKCYKSQDHYLFIIKYNNIPTGVLRFDKIASLRHHFGLEHLSDDYNIHSSYEISLYLATEMQGKGIALKALNYARILFPNIDIWAEILPGNTKSFSLFNKAGYKKIKENIFVNESKHEIKLKD